MEPYLVAATDISGHVSPTQTIESMKISYEKSL